MFLLQGGTGFRDQGFKHLGISMSEALGCKAIWLRVEIQILHIGDPRNSFQLLLRDVGIAIVFHSDRVIVCLLAN